MMLGDVDNSYRKTTALINRVRQQQVDGTPYRTLQANTEQEGGEVIDYLERKTTRILRRHQFLEDGTYAGDKEDLASIRAVTLSPETINKAVGQLSSAYSSKELLGNPVPFEDPAQSVDISIDDVIVKKQTQERNRVSTADDEKSSKHKYVHNT